MLESRFSFIFSNNSLEGTYSYSNMFTLRPAYEYEPKPPFLMAKHPHVLEFYPKCFDEEYESKEWYDQQKIENKIVFELINLLSTITNFRFYHLSNKGSWFLPYNHNERISVWGQESYFPKKIGESKRVLKKVDIIPYNEYYNNYAQRLGTGSINVPDIIESILNKYFSFGSEEKEVFQRVCYLFSTALALKDQRVSHTFSMTSLVSCIETLVAFQHRNEKVEKCLECGQLRFSVIRKFKDFMIKYGSKQAEFKKYVDKIYAFRSKALHEGELMTTDKSGSLELMDSVEIEHFIRTVRICVINWLIRQKSLIV